MRKTFNFLHLFSPRQNPRELGSAFGLPKRFDFLPFVLFALVSCGEGGGSAPVDNDDLHNRFDAGVECLSFLAEEGVPDYIFDWSRGTYVGVFGSALGANAKYAIDDESIDGGNASIYGPNVGGGKIVACYPYDASLGAAADAVRVTVPANQTYVPAEEFYRTFAASASLVGCYDPVADRINFGYPTGCLIVEIRLNASVVSMTVESGSKALSGYGAVDFDLNLVMDASASNRIEYSCGAEPLPTSADAPAKLCVIVPPQTYPSGDLVITVGLADEEPFTCRIDREVVVGRISAERNPILYLTLDADGIPQMDIVNGDLTIYK